MIIKKKVSGQWSVVSGQFICAAHQLQLKTEN